MLAFSKREAELIICVSNKFVLISGGVRALLLVVSRAERISIAPKPRRNRIDSRLLAVVSGLLSWNSRMVLCSIYLSFNSPQSSRCNKPFFNTPFHSRRIQGTSSCLVLSRHRLFALGQTDNVAENSLTWPFLGGSQQHLHPDTAKCCRFRCFVFFERESKCTLVDITSSSLVTTSSCC